MELLAGLFSAWILNLHLNKTNRGFVSVQIWKQTVSPLGSATGNTELRFLSVILFFS